MTALFKKGKKCDPGNYRPVSLTCILCKVLESFIRDAIVNHMNDMSLYSKHQHGFRQNRSCVTQLLEVIEDFTSMIEEGNNFDVIYLDFSKAFDSVPHERLLLKMQTYGIAGNVLTWVEGFLKDRVQRVRVGEAFSRETKVLSGIPQGSILGPILFTIFINDLPDNMECSCKIFADDTKIYNSTDNNDKLQRDLDRMIDWSNTWNLHFNASKCKVVHFGIKNPMYSYNMKTDNDTVTLQTSEEEKDLGVTFDHSLKFDRHITNAISKANKMLGIIKRSFTFRDKDTLTRLYKTLVRPHLEYANTVWHPLLKRQSISIEKVQRRATRLVKSIRHLSYEERLKQLHLPSLKFRRLRGDLIQTYKIFKGLDHIEGEHFFQLVDNGKTRNSFQKIFKKRAVSNIRRNSFSNRITPIWNSLTQDTKNTGSINVQNAIRCRMIQPFASFVGNFFVSIVTVV